MTVLLIIVGVILLLWNPVIGIGFGLWFVHPILGGSVVIAGIILAVCAAPNR